MQFVFQISKIKNLPNYYPEHEIWICCLLLLAGNLNFKFRIVIWNIFLEIWRFEKHIALFENKPHIKKVVHIFHKSKFYTWNALSKNKVWTYWEAHIIRNLPRGFDLYSWFVKTMRNIFFKFCVFLRTQNFMNDVELNALRYTYCALNWCSNNLSLKPLGMMDWNTPPAPNQVRQAKKNRP